MPEDKELLEEIVKRLNTFPLSNWGCMNNYYHHTDSRIIHSIIDGKYKYELESSLYLYAGDYRLRAYKNKKEILNIADESGELLYPLVNTIQEEEERRIYERGKKESERERREEKKLQEELLKRLKRKN